MPPTPQSGRKKYKVGRMIEKYGLDSIETELAKLWSRPEHERQSVRDLTATFNKRILQAGLQSADMNPRSDELTRIYTTLTGEDTTRADQVALRRELSQQGVEIQQIEADFVSYSAIYNYLTDFLDQEYDRREESNQVKKDIERIDKLVGRTESVVSETVDRLSDTRRVTVGDFRVVTQIEIYCNDCGNQYPIRKLLKNRGCSCDPDSEK